MANLSDVLENRIIESTLRGAVFPIPAAIYIALFTADPTDANITANEVQAAAWPAYARMDAAAGGAIASGWAAAVKGITSNAKAINFAANNGANPITVTHLGLYDAAVGGNLLYHGALAPSKTIPVGDLLTFGIGSLALSLK